MKYIDADKLKAEIERRKGYISVTHFAEDILSLIYSLQQEQPEVDCDELEKISEKYAEKMDISKGWFDGCEIDELIKESYKAGYNKAKEEEL